MKRRVLAMIMTAAMAMSILAGCGTSDSGDKAESASAEGKSGDAYTIGISQFAEHGSLDNCREGFLEGLKEAGIEEGVNLEIMMDNAQADTGTAATIADNYVSKGVDMICAIATPSAMSAYNSTMDKDIPVIYTAVTDPVEAGLADKEGTPAGEVTGTSDALPVEEQLKMIRAILPDAKTIGILYSTSETNSVSAIKVYKELAGNYGFEIVDTGINTVADVEMAAKDMASKVDCISNLTDNTVVSALQTVLAAANDAKIPVFGSEIEQVKNGCLAAMGLDYIELGKQTGAIAAKVLKGEEKASAMNYEIITEPGFYGNTVVAEALGIALDDSYAAEAAEMFDTISAQ